jgi:hypothetical protein
VRGFSELRLATSIHPFGFLSFSYLQIQTELSANYIMDKPPSAARRRVMVLCSADSSVWICRLEKERKPKGWIFVARQEPTNF